VGRDGPVKYTVAVDWDGTLVEHRWPENGDWLPGAVDFIKDLQKRGYKVVINSCRASYLKGQTEIREKLREAGLKDVEVHTEPGKPLAVAYVDDRGVQFSGNFNESLARVLELTA
jgi:predicted mannosyl-3-phosphoglycerate phosphatase (HAD superfamily)